MYSYFALCSVAAVAKTLLISLLSMAPSWRFHLPLPLRSLARWGSISALASLSEFGESPG